MPLQVKPRDVARWEALAARSQDEGQAPKQRKKRPKRTPAQLRADLVRAIDLAPSDLGRRVLSRALQRFDEAITLQGDVKK